MSDKQNPLAAFTPVQLIQAYSQLRNSVEAIEAETKEKTQPLTQKMAALTTEILQRMKAEGVENYSTEYGRMTRRTHQNYSIQDIEAFSAYVINEKDLSFFGKALKKPEVKAYIKQHGKTPPGIGVFSEYSIAFTKK